MGDFDSCISCTLGSAAAGGSSFQLIDYGIKPTAVVENGVRIATDYTIEGDGWISGTSPTDFSAAIAAAIAAWKTDAQDFTIRGASNTVEFAIKASDCMEGGPHFDCDLLKARGTSEGSLWRRNFNFTVKARTSANNNNSAYTEAIETSEDGAKVVTRTGSFTGPVSAGTAQLTAFRTLYALPGWTVQSRIEDDGLLTRGTYVFTAQQVLKVFPLGGGAILGGEGSMKRTRDENLRLLNVWSFDLSYSGDPYSVQNGLRSSIPDEDNGPAVREELEFTLYRNARIRASFSYLASAENDGLLEWHQSISEAVNATSYEQLTFPGAAPVLIQKPDEYSIIEQTGSAIAMGEAPEPATPLFDFFTEKPTVTEEAVDAYQFKTSWHYSMFVDGSGETPGGDVADLDFDSDALQRPE